MSSEDFVNLRNFNYVEWDKETAKKYTIAEYIWLDATRDLRSKTKVFDKKINSLDDLDWWTYDGSSTNQATTDQSEIWIKPVFFCRDPFRRENGILVLCEGYLMDKKTPARGNFRYIAEKVMNDAKEHDPWFGIEQEYFLLTRQGTTYSWPLGWPVGGFPYPQGRYYCSVGDFNCFGRAISESHLRACLFAGLKMAGLNAEVAPSQWEFQVGITRGIECGDHMWIARYILLRLGEELGVDINIEPKPIQGDWNGSGAHTNFSTNETRGENGLDIIKNKHLERLKEHHMEHVLVYGEGNKFRLTGSYETSDINTFNYGEGNRGSSIRIPTYTMEKKCGYYEDRRPSSNVDPYIVTAIIVDTTCLDSKHCETIVKAYKKYQQELGELSV